MVRGEENKSEIVFKPPRRGFHLTLNCVLERNKGSKKNKETLEDIEAIQKELVEAIKKDKPELAICDSCDDLPRYCKGNKPFIYQYPKDRWHFTFLYVPEPAFEGDIPQFEAVKQKILNSPDFQRDRIMMQKVRDELKEINFSTRIKRPYLKNSLALDIFPENNKIFERIRRLANEFDLKYKIHSKEDTGENYFAINILRFLNPALGPKEEKITAKEGFPNFYQSIEKLEKRLKNKPLEFHCKIITLALSDGYLSNSDPYL